MAKSQAESLIILVSGFGISIVLSINPDPLKKTDHKSS
jgi:hypothetical protein